jgi:hypothetical protein
MTAEDNSLDGIIQLNEQSVEERLRDFSTLLKNIESLDDKKRALWKEVYSNAVADRQNSYVMFSRLVQICQKDSTQFAIHGKTIAVFVERMSKSNDQLVKLAELIARAEHKDESVDAEDLFSQISKGRR